MCLWKEKGIIEVAGHDHFPGVKKIYKRPELVFIHHVLSLIARSVDDSQLRFQNDTATILTINITVTSHLIIFIIKETFYGSSAIIIGVFKY